MEFPYILSLIENNIHPTPERYRAEVKLVKKILTEGCGYFTKSTPKRVVFYDDNAIE